MAAMSMLGIVNKVLSMSLCIAIFGAIMAVFMIIIFHELGHFCIARCCGIKILRFSIGFGKALYTWRDKTGTEYVFALIPLGGYVRMLGEERGSVDEAAQGSYYSKRLWMRMAVVLAGPLVNFILAFGVFWLAFIVGSEHLKPIVGGVTASSFAAKAGLQVGDEIISVAGQSVSNWQQVAMAMLAQMGCTGEVAMIVRPHAVRFFDLHGWVLDRAEPDIFATLGIRPYVPPRDWSTKTTLFTYKEHYSALSAIVPALKKIVVLSQYNAIFLGKLVTGKLSATTISGPISVFQAAGKATRAGWSVYLSFIGFVSLSIGFINLLPIPGLDGGHFLFQVIEGVARRPVPLKIQQYGFILGVLLIILVMVHATVNDLLRIFQG